MTCIKFGVIWRHRLQDYNVSVLKNDAEISMETHLEANFDFQTYSNEKTSKNKVLQNQYTNTFVKENIIQLPHSIFKMDLKCQKIVAKNLSLVEPPSTKMLLSHS